MVSFRNTEWFHLETQNVGLCKKLCCLQTSLTPMYAYFRKHESSTWYCFETFCGFTFPPTCRTGFPLLFVRRVVTVVARERSCSNVLLLLIILPWQHCASIHPGVWQTDTQSVFARRRNRWPEWYMVQASPIKTQMNFLKSLKKKGGGDFFFFSGKSCEPKSPSFSFLGKIFL